MYVPYYSKLLSQCIYLQCIFGSCMCVCVCACVRVCVFACVRACVCADVYVFVILIIGEIRQYTVYHFLIMFVTFIIGAGLNQV